MNMDGEEPLTQDDREILSDMLFPLFKTAGRRQDNVTREAIRMEIGRFFPWPHIAEVLKELEERDYIDLLSTRGGGIYIPGEKFRQWAGEMTPAVSPSPERQSGELDDIVLNRKEAESLVALIRELAVPAPGEGALKKAHLALTEKAAADIIRKLAG